MIGIIVLAILLWILYPSQTKKDEIIPDITDSFYDDELRKN